MRLIIAICTLHLTYYPQGFLIASLPLDVNQFLFDLHDLFKRQSCKKEDIPLAAKGCDLSTCYETLFLRHVNSRWFFLTPALPHFGKMGGCKELFSCISGKWHEKEEKFS